jgi:hypothetical protein
MYMYIYIYIYIIHVDIHDLVALLSVFSRDRGVLIVVQLLSLESVLLVQVALTVLFEIV